MILPSATRLDHKNEVWNMRGLAGYRTVNRIKALKKLHSFTILPVTEAKMTESMIQQFRLKLDFAHAHTNYKDIWIFWDGGVVATAVGE